MTKYDTTIDATQPDERQIARWEEHPFTETVEDLEDRS